MPNPDELNARLQAAARQPEQKPAWQRMAVHNELLAAFKDGLILEPPEWTSSCTVRVVLPGAIRRVTIRGTVTIP